MLQKSCFLLVFVGFGSLAMADSTVQEIVTSEVFYREPQVNQEYIASEQTLQESTPIWPLVGSDADVEIACVSGNCTENKIVTKVGSGFVVENNIKLADDGWTGGPNIVSNSQIPAGFDYECANDAEMPLMRREMMEDDGGVVLAMSRSSRKMCQKNMDGYALFAERAGFSTSCNDAVFEEPKEDIIVNEYVDEESKAQIQNQVKSWVVTNGQTLREVLQSWCDKDGWDLVWTTSREYPIEASAVFKGRFMDVASALVRNFGRATPIPYAKFYKGNRVLVVSTTEE